MLKYNTSSGNTALANESEGRPQSAVAYTGSKTKSRPSTAERGKDKIIIQE